MTGMSPFENKEGLVSVLLATLGGRSVRPSVWLSLDPPMADLGMTMVGLEGGLGAC
jgi:hypothetical protein